jgi:hypothetical protein
MAADSHQPVSRLSAYRVGKPPMRARMFIVAAITTAVLVASGCAKDASSLSSGAPAASSGGASAGSSGGASSGPGTTTPPASTGYVPAAGTDKNGAIFDTFASKKLGLHMLYPGGWNVSSAKGVTRIAKLGNAILIADRPAKSAPKLKGVKSALKQQRKKKTILQVVKTPRLVKLGSAGPAIRLEFTKSHPATDTSPAGTLAVLRYLLYHNGHIVILSMQSPTDRDNSAAYRLMADSIGWG